MAGGNKSILQKIISVMPPKMIQNLQHMKYTVPGVKAVSDHLRKSIPNEGLILHGVGAGLKFSVEDGSALMLTGAYELQEQESIARLLKPGSVLFDCGANIGFFTVIGAHLVGERGHVYAYEPTPATLDRLRQNCERNGFKNVTIVPMAVSDKPGKATFAVNGVAATNRLEQAGAGKDATRVGSIDVDVTSLDAYIRDTGARPPDVVLLDVEGAELDALRGMEETLRKHKPVVLCEVHYLGTGFIEFIKEYLEPLGYTAINERGGPFPTEQVMCYAIIAPIGSPALSL